MPRRADATQQPAAWALATALLAVVSCGSPGSGVRPEDPFTIAPVEETEVRLHVQNLRFNDARLFAVTPGRRRLLGTVTGKRNAAFAIPFELDQPLHIEIDVLAGPWCTTPTISVDPGDTLELQIREDMERNWRCREH